MKTVKYTAYGAVIGLCIGLVLSFIVGCNAVLSCTGDWINAFFGCGNATCASGCQEYTSNPAVQNCILYSMLVCAVIGGAYGAFQTLQEKKAAQKAAELEQSASAKKQRATWADEVKQKALNVSNICNQNKSADKPLVSTTYKASPQMSDIINELTHVAELQGKIDSLADELTNKRGTAK